MASVSDPTLENVRAVADLERKAVHDRSPMQRFTDAVTQTAGSLAFIVAHLALFYGWVLLNRSSWSFDPYPYSGLNLLLALEAIVLTSFVLMTQNRMTHQADKRAHLDLQVNLLAEQELTAILQMLHALCQKAGTGVKVSDTRVEELLQKTDIIKLSVILDKEMTSKK
jgi:uncharacterized membrane protein